MVLISGILYFLLKNDSYISDEITITEITRLQAAAKVYYSRTRSYDGVCSDIGVSADMVCNAGSEQYAIETALENGTFYCIDSSGFKGIQTFSKNNEMSCK